jgi:hypothetical protein
MNNQSNLSDMFVTDCAGVITFFREGCTPVSYVEKLFEEVKAGRNFPPCTLLHSHKAKDLQKAALLLQDGGVRGSPSCHQD